MANIKNKYSSPLSTEFTPKDLVVDIKNGHLYYKSNLGVHKLIGDNLSTDTEEGDIWQSGVSNALYYDGGNVGIGTTTPGASLEVMGSISASGTIFTDTISSPSNNLVVSSSTVTITTSGSDANLILQADTGNNDEANNPYMTIEQDGGVMRSIIGLTGADSQWPDGGPLLNGKNNHLIIGTSGSEGTAISKRGIQLVTLNTASLTISASGNVGIGTTGPDKLLTVKQSKADEFISRFQNSSDTNPDGIIIRLDKDQHTNKYISFQRNSGHEAGSITGTGDGGGDQQNQNKVSYNESSDRRLKSNIRDCDFTINDLDKIQMRSYTMGGGDNQVGVIAQELLNTPHKWMVYTGTEENKSNKLKEGDNGYQYMQVGYNHFTPLLIKSVQDANKMIKELQQELKILKKKVNG